MQKHTSKIVEQGEIINSIKSALETLKEQFLEFQRKTINNMDLLNTKCSENTENISSLIAFTAKIVSILNKNDIEEKKDTGSNEISKFPGSGRALNDDNSNDF